MKQITEYKEEYSITNMEDPNWRKAYSEALSGSGMERSTANAYAFNGRTFNNVLPGITVKSQYAQADYDYFRQNEAVPTNPREIIEVCNRAYKQEGLIRNTIDLMAEFACKGIQVVHPNKRQEQFGQQWFEYVNGVEVSERFLNTLYRLGNVPVSITYGKVPVVIEKKWSSAYGLDQPEMSVPQTRTVKRRMPLKYTFLNPSSIEVVSPELSAFTGEPAYQLIIGRSLKNALNKASRTYNTAQIEEQLSRIPLDIRGSLTSNNQTINLSNDDFCMYYYKKDDWETYATPLLYSIISDVVTLKKMKLADRSALDGAISNIRLWKIGQLNPDPRLCIIPTKAAINKLRSILAQNVGGGTLDLVWGPDLDFKESNTQVHKFLGIGKYEPIYRNIYEGLGIPSSSGGSAGFNSTFIQMQTFIERLEYGRGVLNRFWNQELKKVQTAMGYKKPFKISFDQINLGDDNAIKKLLMDLVDRDIISMDTLLDRFDIFSDVEIERIKREYKQRQKENVPNKASPFHNPQSDDEIKRIILNQGGVAPSELGVQLQDRKPGEESLIEKQSKLNIQEEKFKPKAMTNGRPKNSSDTQPRKKRAVKVSKTTSRFYENFSWANQAQKTISEIITPAMLKTFNKSNARKLTKDEFERVESMKFIILSQMTPQTEVNKETIYNISSDNPDINTDIYRFAQACVYKFTEMNNRKPNTEEMHEIQASAFALHHEPNEDYEE